MDPTFLTMITAAQAGRVREARGPLQVLPALLALSTIGCPLPVAGIFSGIPRAPVASSRDPLPVNASSGRTWDAAIDVLAANSIPIRWTDRPTGSMATDRNELANSDTAWSECGRDTAGRRLPPEWAVYNITVHGDSSTSIVMVAISWSMTPRPGVASSQCVTSGVRESQLERSIKQRAERASATS